MVNLRYLISVLHAAITDSTSNVIETCLFLFEADIGFLKSNGCLMSINPTDIPDKYTVRLDRNQLSVFCN